MSRRPYLLLGGGLALFIIFLDQLVKWVMLDIMDIANRPPVEVTPFFNFVMVWNYGVSFGMLSHPSSNVPYFLIAVALVIISVMIGWLWQCRDTMLSLAIGLVIGGALGNVIDRFRFGAVADFFDVHIMGWHWPAFNIADSSIFIGVAILLWDGLFRAKSKAKT